MAVNPKEITQRNFVSIKINGKSYFGDPSETILQISQRNGIEIPHLCYKEGMRPDGNCRACMVEIEGERVLQPSCVRTISDGMIINTDSSRVKSSQKIVLELLSSDVSDKVYKKKSELTDWAEKLEIKKIGFLRMFKKNMILPTLL